MKKVLSIFLALMLIFSVSVTALATKENKETATVQKDTEGKYFKAMKTLADEYSITLTDNYFVLDLGLQNMTGTTVSAMGMTISTSSTTELTGMACWAVDAGDSDVVASFFGNGPQAAGKSVKITDSSGSAYINLTDSTCIQTAAFLGPKFCFDLLTEITSDTTVTVDIYLGSTATGDQTTIPENPLKVLTYTHTFHAQTQEPEPGKNNLVITAEDRDTVSDGLQVYAGDDVTVSVTAENEENVTVGYDSDLLTPKTHTGWTDNGRQLTWNGGDTVIGNLVFTAKPQTENNKTAEFTLSTNSGSTNPADTKSVIIVLKPMKPDTDYVIEDIERFDGFNKVSFVYNGEAQSVMAYASLAGASIQYAEWQSPGDDLTWSSTNPVRVTDCSDFKQVAIRVTAPGYATTTEIVQFSLEPDPADHHPQGHHHLCRRSRADQLRLHCKWPVRR